MKFELEIFDQDLQDRALVIGMRDLIEGEIEKLSDFSRNNLVNQVNFLRGALEQLENRWLYWQKERLLNQLSQVLNVDRAALGDKCWCDD